MVFIHSRDYDCQSQHGHVDGLGRFVGTTRKVALHTLDSTYSTMYFSPFGDLTAGLHQNTNCIFGRALLGDMQTWLGPCECQLDSRFPVSAGSRSTRDARACHLVALTVSVSEASCNTFIVNTRSTSNTSTVTCFLSNAHAWSLG